MSCFRLSTFVALGMLGSAASGEGRVIITEIMYNPASAERRGESEWVEIANVGDEPIEIRGWRLDDEDDSGGADWGPFNCRLEPRHAAVIVNKAAVDEAAFRQAWDPVPSDDAAPPPPYQVIPVMWGNLANNASAQNEILQLLDAAGETICRVNFENGGDWPRCSGAGGASISLTDLAAADLSSGRLWKKSKDGTDGARTCRTTAVFNGADVGSPGFVPGLSPAGVPTVTPPSPEDKPDKPEADSDDEIDY